MAECVDALALLGEKCDQSMMQKLKACVETKEIFDIDIRGNLTFVFFGVFLLPKVKLGLYLQLFTKPFLNVNIKVQIFL